MELPCAFGIALSQLSLSHETLAHMQKPCENLLNHFYYGSHPWLSDEKVEEICTSIQKELLLATNY